MDQYTADLLRVSGSALGADHRRQVMLVAWILVAILLAVFARIALRFSRLESSSDFLLMGRGIGFWLFFGAYTGASIGGASLAGFTGTGFSTGISTMWILVVSSFTVPLFAWAFGPALNRFGRRFEAFTLADFLVHRYGETLRRPALLLTYIRPTFITGLQFLAVGTLLRAGFGLGRSSGILGGAAIVLLISLIGGQYSAITSQWVQALLQGLGMMLFLVAALALHGGVTEGIRRLHETLPASFLDPWSMDFSVLSVWILSMGVFYFVDPWLFQWAYMARNERTSRNALVVASVAAPWGAVSFLGGLLLAAAVRGGILDLGGSIDPDLVYLTFLQDHLATPVAAFLLVSFLMTVLSCASSFLMNGATILQADLLAPMLGGERARRHPILLGRLAVAVTGLLGIAAALWVPVLVPLWIIGQTLTMAGLLFPVLAAWFWPRATAAGAVASLAAGGVSSFAWALLAWRFAGSANALWHGLHAAHVGLGVSLVALVTVSLVTAHGEAERPRETLWKRLRLGGEAP